MGSRIEWADTRPDPEAEAFDRLECSRDCGMCDQGRKCRAREELNPARGIVYSAILCLALWGAGWGLYLAGRMWGVW
jgi:hypothetical protein